MIMGLFLEMAKKYDEALRVMENALQFEKVFEHENYIRTLKYLSEICYKLGLFKNLLIISINI